MRLLYSICILLIGSAVYSQEVKTEMFQVKNASQRISSSERKYIQYTETKEGFIKFNSILTRKIERINFKGRETVLFVQKYGMEKSIDTDSSYCDPETLLPIAYFTNISSEGYKEQVFFSGDSIYNTVFYKDSVIRKVVRKNDIYNGVVSDDIIALIPFKKSNTYIFNAVNTGLRYFEYTVTVRIEGQENIEIPGLGKIVCWKVRVEINNANPTIHWYSVDGQVEIKKMFRLRNGNIFYRILLAE